MAIANANQLGRDVSHGGVFGNSNLTPGGTFSNIPQYFEYGSTTKSTAKLLLTLQKVKDSIAEQLKQEQGVTFSAVKDNSLIESFLYEFTSLLIDYRDLRNLVFFGSAYTELAYNIKYLVDNYPYKFLISGETATLDQYITYTNDISKEQTTITFKQSAIKDGIDEFNFFDNNLDFKWRDYDLVDNSNRRYPIFNIITPSAAANGIYTIGNISQVTVTNPDTTKYAYILPNPNTNKLKLWIDYDTLQITTTASHNYSVGQGINIFENILSTGTLNDNYIVSEIISPTVFNIVNKYSGQKMAESDLRLVTEAVQLPVGATVNSGGKIRKVPLSLNAEPYEIKIIVSGNITVDQFLTYKDDFNVDNSGFMLSKKQTIISEFEYNLTPIQKMLLSPIEINPTPWPRNNVTQNIQTLLSDTQYSFKDEAFVGWLQSPDNLYIQKPLEENDLAYGSTFSEYNLVRALALDETATNQLLRRCIPQDVISEINDTINAYFQRFILIAGWFFDQIKVYIDFIKYVHHLNYSDFNQLSPEYYKYYADYYGFELFSDDSIDFSELVIKTEPGYYFIQNTVDTTSKYYRFTLKQLEYEKQKRLLLSLFYLYKTKGTPGALKKLV